MSNQCTRTKYTVEQKLRGQDLHGLSCRVPEPTPEQAKCSHEDTKSREVMDNWKVIITTRCLNTNITQAGPHEGE